MEFETGIGFYIFKIADSDFGVNFSYSRYHQRGTKQEIRIILSNITKSNRKITQLKNIIIINIFDNE